MVNEFGEVWIVLEAFDECTSQTEKSVLGLLDSTSLKPELKLARGW